MSTYDQQWSLNYTHDPNNTTVQDESGVFLGNGKIGIITSMKPAIDVHTTMITSQLRYYNGSYRPNVIQPFSLNCVKLFDNKDTNVEYALQTQKLNMLNAIFTASYMVTELTTGKTVQVETDMYTPQHLPFCIMQTLRITPTFTIDAMDLYHEVYANESIVDVEYNNNMIYNESFNITRGLNILSGKGKTRLDGDSVVCASSYLLEMDESQYEILGYNVYRNNLNKCYNKFKLLNLEANITYKIHIINGLMTSFDFENPAEEIKRIVFNVMNKSTSPQGVANLIRTEHTNSWVNIWNTDINITPKAGITSAELDKIQVLKRNVRYSLYNIYSSIRENINLEINPFNLSVIDYDGSILYDGDLWLIPLLLFIKPDVARVLIEYRHKMIDTARQLAAGYGYKGTKFPYVNDTIGYKNALYWDTSGPMSIFNTALVAVNVWNYFRITKDRDWLQTKGYTILKEIADFLASAVEKSPDNTYHLRNVVSIGGVQSLDQNSFTNNVVRLALRSAIEASYELNYMVKELWLNTYYYLPLSYFPNPLNFALPEVLKIDAQSILSDTCNIAEPLFVLLPYYNKLYFAPENNHSSVSVYKNMTHYTDRIVPSMQQHPINVSLFAIMNGMYAQYDPAFTDDFEEKLEQLLTSTCKGVWGHFTQVEKGRNDITLNAIFLFVLLQGAAKLNVIGGVAESRFYYEDMRLHASTSANLPTTWKNIRLMNIGTGTTFTVTNSLYYTQAGCGCP